MITKGFTPGPWSTRTSKTGKVYVEGPDEDPDTKWLVAEVAGRGPEGDVANARLIAAAPDLYEALRSFVSPSYEPPAGVATVTLTLTLTPAEYRAARAALAKAEGT